MKGDYIVIYYTVEPGNTLWGIGQFFGISAEELARYNGIAFPDKIYVGQQLKIPVEISSTPNSYTVRPGDTLWSIASRYGISPAEIIDLNSLPDPNVIYPGQKLRLS